MINCKSRIKTWMRILKMNIRFGHKNYRIKTRLQNRPQQWRKAKAWFVFPLLLRTATIFSISPFKAPRFCGDSSVHQIQAAHHKYQFGKTTRQEIESILWNLRNSTRCLLKTQMLRNTECQWTEVQSNNIKKEVTNGFQQTFMRTWMHQKYWFYLPGTHSPAPQGQHITRDFRQCWDEINLQWGTLGFGCLSYGRRKNSHLPGQCFVSGCSPAQ